MKTGDKVRIVDIGGHDAFYHARDTLIGRTGTLLQETPLKEVDLDIPYIGDPWHNKDIPICFYSATLEKVKD